MLIVFGTMFLAVAHDAMANRNLIPYGMMLKRYTGLCVYYWVATDCPLLFKPFAIVDGVMFFLFLIAFRTRPTAT